MKASYMYKHSADFYKHSNQTCFILSCDVFSQSVCRFDIILFFVLSLIFKLGKNHINAENIVMVLSSPAAPIPMPMGCCFAFKIVLIDFWHQANTFADRLMFNFGNTTLLKQYFEDTAACNPPHLFNSHIFGSL